MVAERILPGRRLAVKVVYNLGAEDERIVVTVELGRPTRRGPGGAGRKRVMTYRFEHDPESGAFYIRVRDGEYHETIPLAEPGFGAGVDAKGNVLGFEFLSFEEYKQVVDEGGGRKEVPDRLQPSYAPALAFDPERLREALDDALDSLPQRHRAVLELIYFEDLSRSEAAQRLQVSITTVRQLQHDALRKIRVALEREEDPVRVDNAELEAFLSTL